MLVIAGCCVMCIACCLLLRDLYVCGVLCLLNDVCCVFAVVCCMLNVRCWVLCCLLCVVGCWLLFDARCLLCAATSHMLLCDV